MTLLPKSSYVQTRSIGGSDAAAVMGRSRYKTAAQVYDAIVGPAGIRPTEKDRGPTERGRSLENLAAEMFTRDTGYQTVEQERIWCEQHPFLHASPDRLILDEHGNPFGILEIKCPASYILRNWKEDGIPQEYYIQIQHYLFVTGFDKAIFAALDYDSWKIWTVPVERDEQTIAEIVDRCTTFWLDYVEQGIRPPDAEPSPMDIRWPNGRPGAPKVRNDHEWIHAVHAVELAQTDVKLAQRQLEIAQDRVKELMGEDEEVIGGSVKVRWPQQIRRTFNLSAFMEAKGLTEDDVTPFYKTTSVRPFSIHPVKEAREK